MNQENINEYSPQNIDSLKYADNNLQRILDQQLNSVDSLLTSVSILIGLAGILAGVIMAWGIPEKFTFSTFFLFLTLVALIFSIFLSLFAALSVDYQYGYDPNKLWEHTGDSELEIIQQVYSENTRAYKSNRDLLRKKWGSLRKSTIEIVLAILAMSIYIILTIGKW
jgi:hypothetical protein